MPDQVTNYIAKMSASESVQSSGAPRKEEMQKIQEFPYNLLYAQQMLNMAQQQSHQWEMYAFMMNQQLSLAHMQANQQPMYYQQPAYLGGSTAAAMNSLNSNNVAQPAVVVNPPTAHVSAVAQPQVTLPQAPAQREPQPAVAVAQQPDAAVPGAAAAAAAAEGAAAVAAANGENANAEGGENANAAGGLWGRFRIGPIVKVALIMLLLEVKPVWFFVYFFAVFLYLGGIFDPIVEWFKTHAAQQPLEAQLVNLREREQQAVPEDTPPSNEPTAELTGENQPSSSSNPGEEKGEGEEESPTKTADESTPSSGLSATPKTNTENGNKTDGTVAAPGAEEEQPPGEQPNPVAWIIRFCYQLFVMFVMTLLPMWNPDPRYLH